jgi:hypothetical protein
MSQINTTESSKCVLEHSMCFTVHAICPNRALHELLVRGNCLELNMKQPLTAAHLLVCRTATGQTYDPRSHSQYTMLNLTAWQIPIAARSPTIADGANNLEHISISASGERPVTSHRAAFSSSTLTSGTRHVSNKLDSRQAIPRYRDPSPRPG